MTFYAAQALPGEIKLQKFKTNIDRKTFLQTNTDWVPVSEKMQEIKDLESDIHYNPLLAELPWPLRVRCKERDVVGHLKFHKDKQRTGFFRR